MNPRRLILIIAAISASAIIVSCGTTSPASKLIVGNWKPVRAEKYYEPGYNQQNVASLQDTTKPMKMPVSKKDTLGKSKGGNAPAGPSAKEQKDKLLAKWDHMVITEERSGLVIKSDKTLQKIFKNKTVELTWKMKGNGKSLIAKDAENKQKYHVQIVSITDSSLVLIEKVPQFDLGGIKVYYHRSK